MRSTGQLPAAVALFVLAASAVAAPLAGEAPETRAVLVAEAASRADPVVFDNGNVYVVYTPAGSAPILRIERRTRITAITTYHWNDGHGADPGFIGLVDSRGRTFGPWGADGSPGQGGVRDAYWTVRPNITLSAGSYTVIDSDPDSWANNEATGGAGMVRVEGRVR